MTDPHPLPDALQAPTQTTTARLARAARDGDAREFGRRIYALAMRYGDARAQAAAQATHDGGQLPAPSAAAWTHAADIADRLATELDPGRAHGPARVGPGCQYRMDRELGRFAALMSGDPFTDPLAHAMLSTLRQVVRRYEEAMTDEGVPPDRRDRVMKTVLFGDPRGYVEEDVHREQHRVAHAHAAAHLMPDGPRKP